MLVRLFVILRIFFILQEFRDSARNASSSQINIIKNLESKIKKFTSHTQKQSSLIDNLKKQIYLLQTDSALKVLEKDYLDFLNQD